MGVSMRTKSLVVQFVHYILVRMTWSRSQRQELGTNVSICLACFCELNSHFICFSSDLDN